MAAAVKRLDHVNLRTANLESMIPWYGRVLDMHPGPRPGFDFPGAWLYADGHPIVHLVGVEMAPRADPGDLRLEHFAISACGLKEFLSRLDAAPCRLSRIPEFDIVQVNIHDPDGNHIHIDFDAAEAEGLRI